MSLMLRDVGVSRWMRLCGSPSKIIPPHLNVVIRELAELIIIHTQKLGFLRRSQVESRDEVDGVRQDQAHDEGVGASSDNVGDLNVKLCPISVDPASSDDAGVDAIKTDDVGRAEDGIEDQTDYSGDTVLSEDIHCIIDLDPVLD